MATYSTIATHSTMTEHNLTLDDKLAMGEAKKSEREIIHRHESTVCIVGGGPAGMILAYLLARQGISVALLEAQKDFDRNFRGDTIHAGVMDNLDEMGLAERILALPHHKLGMLSLGTDRNPEEKLILADFRRLKTKHPYVTIIAQSIFLAFMAEETQQYPNFKLLMQANAQELIQEEGVVKGVRYRHGRAWGEVRSTLVVAADGRASRIRKLAGLEPVPTTKEPIDVLWFRLPRSEADGDTKSVGLASGTRLPVVLLEREDHWQLGLIIPNGGYRHLREEGLDAFQKRLAEDLPQFAERIYENLDEWRKMAYLNVRGSRLKEWYQPGLLFIGDAAHVMTPLGGVGINYAIQDAIVAANILSQPLKAGTITTDHLAKVQKTREWPIKVIQMVQSQGQKRIVQPNLDWDKPFEFPPLLRLLPKIPFLRDLPGKVIGMGVRQVRVETS